MATSNSLLVKQLCLKRPSEFNILYSYKFAARAAVPEPHGERSICLSANTVIFLFDSSKF